MEIDQLLFGYRDGHELLASSVRVDARIEAELLPHADARFEASSNHYLVGLWVRSLDRFMLTRIWPAPELPRPGAVWAHSLLLEDTALAFIDPLLLLDLFHRPSEAKELDRYTSTLNFNATGTTQVGDVPNPLMAALCDAVYRSRSKAAVVIWPDERDAEFGLMALWRRMPMQDRRLFSFRSRGRARTGTSPYRVQLATQLGGRSASEELCLVIPSEIQPSRAVMLLAEASQDPSHPFGRVLDEFAIDAADSFAIAELWPLLGKADPPALLDRLAAMDSHSLASRLASALFGPAGIGPQWWDVDEGRRLVALLESSAPIGQGLLDMPRLRATWDRDRRAMLALLDQRERLPSASAEMLLQSAIQAMAVEDLLARAGDRKLFSRALDARTELLSQPRLWTTLEKSSDAELGDLALSKAGRETVPILIETESWRLLERALLDTEMLAAGVALVAERSPTDAALWNRALGSHGPDIARLLSSKEDLPKASVVLAAAELHRGLLDQVPAWRWAAAAPLIHGRDDDVALTAAARLVAWTARQKKPSREMLVECFGPTHRALEARQLPARAAEELDQSLPHPKMKSLSKRLSRALIENMESVNWSQSELRRALEPAGPEADRMIKYVPKKHPARRLVEGTLRDLEEMLPLP